ncbi:MAG: ABC transporter ATP-binding protein [Clostridia bacterium]|nr:ABC transporter ATP-binding protein [Clostridia bacterium]
MKIRSDLKMIKKGVGYIHRLAPGNLALKLVKNVFNAIIPFLDLYFSALIIDSLVRRDGMLKTILYAVLLVVLNLVFSMTSEIMEIKNYRMFNGLFRRYKMMISNKVMSLDYEKIEDPKTHVTVKNIDDAMRVSNYGLIKLHSRIPLLFQNVLSAALSVSLIISVLFIRVPQDSAYSWIAGSPFMIIGLILSVALVTAWNVISGKKIAGKTYGLLGIFSKINRVYDYYLNDYLSGHKAGKDIRLYSQDELISDEIEKTNEKSCGIVKNINDTATKYRIVGIVLDVLLLISAYMFVGIKALSGAVSVGDVVMYSGAILQFSGAFSGAMDAAAQLSSNRPYLKTFLDFMDAPEANNSASLPLEVSVDMDFEIEFRNLSFRYPGCEEFVLKNVSFKIKRGEKIAVVGTNGSGKSTLVKLICRLYEPTEGQILLNGTDVSLIKYDDYLNFLAVVFQDFKLFSFSLGQNVAADTEYDAEKVRRCLDEAGFNSGKYDDRKGLDTILYKDFDEEGIELSGGEAQKISIARALYKGAPFIILDEPTSALDPISESEIYSSLGEILKSRTAVFVSHRLSSCRFCSRILVFSDGGLVDSGNHGELLERCGLYSDMWHAQAQYYV